MRALVEREVAERSDAERAMHRQHLESMAVPDTRPAYGRLLVDADGDLWAAEYSRYPFPPAQWTVFDPDGRLLGTVDTPERFDLQQVGPDWVLGVWRDPLGVEYVRRYPLMKP